MTLVTWTRVPPSCAATLPQTFSAATTWIWAAARAAARMCMARRSISIIVIITGDEGLGDVDAAGARGARAPAERRAAGGRRAPRPAALLRDRAGDLRPLACRGAAGRDRERLPHARAADARRL